MSILVSINCITYNHEKYIKSALDGFLAQKTNFEYEIVIGEDCSTDGTRAIVKEYAGKYPDKIVLVISDENVGASNNEKRIFEKSRGKYIALCEGDDYWTDPYKLQKQIDYMENNPQCTFCFHNAEVFDDETGKIKNLMVSKKIKSGIYSSGGLAVLGFIPTASFVYKRECMVNLPEWYDNAIVGDLPTKLITSSYGYAYYIDDVMSVYRVNVEGSFMTKWKKEHKSRQKKLEHNKGYLYIFDEFNKFSNNKYFEDIDKVKIPYEVNVLINSGGIKELRKERYKEYYNNLSVMTKIKVFLIRISPGLYDFISNIINK